MFDDAVKTLFYPFDQGAVSLPEKGKRVLFVNAAPHPALEEWKELYGLYLQQGDAVLLRSLQNSGFKGNVAWPEEKERYDAVFLFAPKQHDEAQAMMARAASYLAEEGVFLCAASNDAGGGRLVKDMTFLWGAAPSSLSKHRARVVWAYKRHALFRDDVIREWTAKGRMVVVPQHGLWSCPGIFGWNKIDRGSEILAAHLPDGLEGAGADFGCGYGYLSDFILRNCQGIKALSCIDCDVRALEACQKNLKDVSGETKIIYIHDDLTSPCQLEGGFDWVVMNPPFHQGKKETIDAGWDFVKSAAKFLRKKGCLWMVSNNHLPYEKQLETSFSSYKNIFEGDGFKVFCAIK